jgi:hypothetical protein
MQGSCACGGAYHWCRGPPADGGATQRRELLVTRKNHVASVLAKKLYATAQLGVGIKTDKIAGW